ncbi:MAG: nucleoside triphosphate pyrophosphohydrolase family protein, partial [Candidatus Dormibacteria bacterium]
FNEYQTLAFRTARIFENINANLIHASLGLATESGEFTSEIKRMAIYGKPFDEKIQIHLVEELGDILWYIALAATHLDISLGTIARMNIEKLQLRFPDAFSPEAAEARADKGGLPHTES